MDFTLSHNDKSLLLGLARSVLEAFEEEEVKKVVGAFEENPKNLTPVLLENLPCFVTLTSRADRLRGCIGTLQTFNSLYKNVVVFTQHAAFEDPRFEPVKKNEVPNLHIHIAVLGPLFAMKSIEDIKIGRHGLMISQGRNRGVLLASVAVDYGWHPDQFIEATCEKAGLDPKDWRNYQIELFEEVSFEEARR